MTANEYERLDGGLPQGSDIPRRRHREHDNARDEGYHRSYTNSGETVPT